MTPLWVDPDALERTLNAYGPTYAPVKECEYGGAPGQVRRSGALFVSNLHQTPGAREALRAD